MSTSKLTIAALLATAFFTATTHAQYSVQSVYQAPFATPVDDQFVGRYDATIHFSGAINAGNKTIYVQARRENGSWSTVASTRSAQLPIAPGQYRWSADESLTLDEWEILEYNGSGLAGETTVRAVTYGYSGGWGRSMNVLGQATIRSYSYGS